MGTELIELENKLKGLEEDFELPVTHTFGEGMYIRTLEIPKDCLIVGKRHRHKTMNMLTKGKMTIYDEHSSFTVEAPFIAEAEAFTKKAGYAHEDSIWVNIHLTDSKDLEEIEEQVIIPEEEYQSLLENKGDTECLG